MRFTFPQPLTNSTTHTRLNHRLQEVSPSTLISAPPTPSARVTPPAHRTPAAAVVLQRHDTRQEPTNCADRYCLRLPPLTRDACEPEECLLTSAPRIGLRTSYLSYKGTSTSGGRSCCVPLFCGNVCNTLIVNSRSERVVSRPVLPRYRDKFSFSHSRHRRDDEAPRRRRHQTTSNRR